MALCPAPGLVLTITALCPALGLVLALTAGVIDDLGHKSAITQHALGTMQRALRSDWQRLLERTAARLLSRAFLGQAWGGGGGSHLSTSRRGPRREPNATRLGLSSLKGFSLGLGGPPRGLLMLATTTMAYAPVGVPDTPW